MVSGSGDCFDVLVVQERLILEATELIERLLGEHHMTRKQLADKLGTSKSHVTQMLSGERNMTLATLAEIGVALGVTFHLMAEELTSG